MESSNQKSENLRSAACYNATFLLGGEKKNIFSVCRYSLSVYLGLRGPLWKQKKWNESSVGTRTANYFKWGQAIA